MHDEIYFAIGDVHGELSRLKRLHGLARTHVAERFPDCELVFVHLGDLVDRGHDSCGVVDYVMNLHETASEGVHTLRGNHEDLMLKSCRGGDVLDRNTWMNAGGDTTLASYKAAGFNEPPDIHLDWLETLPHILEFDARDLIFVHAGVHPSAYPNCGEEVHLWSRKRTFFDVTQWEAGALMGKTVVHGHTPTRDRAPDFGQFENQRRINVDTGAVYGGPLTGVGLAPNAAPFYLST